MITLGGKLFKSTNAADRLNNNTRQKNRFHLNSDFVGLFAGLAFIALV